VEADFRACGGIRVLLNCSASNDDRNISLCDCTVNDISQENDDVIFDFDNGFWLLQKNELNQFVRNAHTDKSSLRFSNVSLEASDIYMFKPIRLFGIRISTVRIKIKFPIFCARINRGDWQFIFKDEIYDDIRAVFDGYIYSKLKRRYRKCQIVFENEGTVYSWNEICGDRTGIL
jgi:hypothetical protein